MTVDSVTVRNVIFIRGVGPFARTRSGTTSCSMFRWLLIGLCGCACAHVRVCVCVCVYVCLCVSVSVFVVVLVVVFGFDFVRVLVRVQVRVLVIVRVRPSTIDQDDARGGTAQRLE